MADGESKPNVEPKSENNHIGLKVKSADGAEVFFKIKRTTPLEKLMTAYCQKQGLSADQIVFLFDGQRLNPTQTPDTLDMEDQDEIDAMVHQSGGK